MDSNISSLLRDALSAVNEAEVPESLRAVAFERAFDFLAAQRGLTPMKPLIRPPATGQPAQGGPSIGEIAASLGVANDVADELFSTGESGPELIVATARLASEKAKATKQIALLLCAVRQAAGLEWTPADIVREAVVHYGRHDSPNFAGSLNELHPFSSFRGKARKRELKLNKAGQEEAVRLMQKLTGHEA